MMQPGARAEPMFLQSLLDMGFPQLRAEKALILTHNCGLEPAINWMVEHADDPESDSPLDIPLAAAAQLQSQPRQPDGGGAAEPAVGIPAGASLVVHPDGRSAPAHVVGVQGETKVVLLVPRSLGMGPGKIGAQCAHAAVGLYKRLATDRVPWLRAWEAMGEKTVVLAVDSSEHLQALADAAEAAGLHPYAVHDAGRTEVAPGSFTVLALGGFSEAVDRVTGHLRTL